MPGPNILTSPVLHGAHVRASGPLPRWRHRGLGQETRLARGAFASEQCSQGFEAGDQGLILPNTHAYTDTHTLTLDQAFRLPNGGGGAAGCGDKHHPIYRLPLPPISSALSPFPTPYQSPLEETKNLRMCRQPNDRPSVSAQTLSSQF